MAADHPPAFRFLELPRELRDLIYKFAFSIPEERSDRALRIERRHLVHFKPSPCSILLVLRHEYLLLNQQVAREALEALFKNHTVFLCCGPYVLKQLLTRIEEYGGVGRDALKWLKRIELEWITFPNLKSYPPEGRHRRKLKWMRDDDAVQLDNEMGEACNEHYDEHDCEGAYYDDNLYGAQDLSLYPDWQEPAASTSSQTNNAFDLAHHDFFSDNQEALQGLLPEIQKKFKFLISTEVVLLFNYLSTPLSALTSITLPLYFVSKQSRVDFSTARFRYDLPLRARYWTQVCIQALLMLHRSSLSSDKSAPVPTLKEVRIKYMPWDIWAAMDPADNLSRMAKLGVWYKDGDDPHDERELEGESFRAVWAGLRNYGLCLGDDRMGLQAQVEFVMWEGDLTQKCVGNELRVVFTNGPDGEGTRDKDVEMENAAG